MPAPDSSRFEEDSPNDAEIVVDDGYDDDVEVMDELPGADDPTSAAIKDKLVMRDNVGVLVNSIKGSVYAGIVTTQGFMTFLFILIAGFLIWQASGKTDPPIGAVLFIFMGGVGVTIALVDWFSSSFDVFSSLLGFSLSNKPKRVTDSQLYSQYSRLTMRLGDQVGILTLDDFMKRSRSEREVLAEKALLMYTASTTKRYKSPFASIFGWNAPVLPSAVTGLDAFGQPKERWESFFDIVIGLVKILLVFIARLGVTVLIAILLVRIFASALGVAWSKLRRGWGKTPVIGWFVGSLDYLASVFSDALYAVLPSGLFRAFGLETKKEREERRKREIEEDEQEASMQASIEASEKAKEIHDETRVCRYVLAAFSIVVVLGTLTSYTGLSSYMDLFTALLIFLTLSYAFMWCYPRREKMLTCWLLTGCIVSISAYYRVVGFPISPWASSAAYIFQMGCLGVLFYYSCIDETDDPNVPTQPYYTNMATLETVVGVIMMLALVAGPTLWTFAMVTQYADTLVLVITGLALGTYMAYGGQVDDTAFIGICAVGAGLFFQLYVANNSSDSKANALANRLQKQGNQDPISAIILSMAVIAFVVVVGSAAFGVWKIPSMQKSSKKRGNLRGA